MYIGSHVRFNGEQLLGSVKEAISYGANTFMFYTGAPQNSIRTKINDELTLQACDLMIKNNIDINKVICHAPYIINLANKMDDAKYNFSIDFLKNELKRCEKLKVKYLVLHPGSYVKDDPGKAIINIIEGLNIVLEDTSVMILLETMAGKGTEIGSKMEELDKIIKGVNYSDKIGVCIDTCHLNDSGVNLEDFDHYLNTFDKYIGIDKIKCVHINDSKNEIASHKDRHENIGYGSIGFDNLLNIVYHEKLKDVPKILETPYVNEKALYKYEIDMIKDKSFNDKLHTIL